MRDNWQRVTTIMEGLTAITVFAALVAGTEGG